MCLVLEQTKLEDLRPSVSQFNLILQKVGARKPGMAASAYGPVLLWSSTREARWINNFSHRYDNTPD